eukprot:COSAG02_NODE_279_length_25809_cov_21.674173_6_plen_81_part_00
MSAALHCGRRTDEWLTTAVPFATLLLDHGWELNEDETEWIYTKQDEPEPEPEPEEEEEDEKKSKGKGDDEQEEKEPDPNL